MIGQRGVARLVGVGRGLVADELSARLRVHHQNKAPPTRAIRITPIIVSLTIQRTASLAINTKIANRTTAPMM
jgi:hypothetical protein